MSQALVFFVSQQRPAVGVQSVFAGVHCPNKKPIIRMPTTNALVERNTNNQVRHLLGSCSLYMSRATDIFPVVIAIMQKTWETKSNSMTLDNFSGGISKKWRAPP